MIDDADEAERLAYTLLSLLETMLSIEFISVAGHSFSVWCAIATDLGYETDALIEAIEAKRLQEVGR